MPRGKRGAPPGNINALRHGFYSQALGNAQALDLAEAQDLQGLQDEIAVLRTKIKALLTPGQENLDLLLTALNTLGKLLVIQYRLKGQDKENFTQALTATLTHFADMFAELP